MCWGTSTADLPRRASNLFSATSSWPEHCVSSRKGAITELVFTQRWSFTTASIGRICTRQIPRVPFKPTLCFGMWNYCYFSCQTCLCFTYPGPSVLVFLSLPSTLGTHHLPHLVTYPTILEVSFLCFVPHFWTVSIPMPQPRLRDALGWAPVSHQHSATGSAGRAAAQRILKTSELMEMRVNVGGTAPHWV